jgi:hypothetical protein
MGDQELFEEFIAGLEDIEVDVIYAGEFADIISIDGQGLSEIPTSIGRFANLRVLYLNNNDLSQLPSALKYLRHLERIELSSNEFSEFPVELTEVKSLLDINLSHNAIAELPDSLAELKELENLDLSANQISSTPDMTSMRSLSDINLSANRLTLFPSFPGESMKKVDLRQNSIDNLKGIEKLVKLETLQVQDNPLKTVPTGLSDLEELINVDLRNTQLKKIDRVYSGRFAVKDLQSYLSKIKESDETHTCPFCGHIQGIALIICEECEHQFAHCFVCKKGFVNTIRANCTECGEQFHDDHIRRVLKLTNKCPNCKSANSIIL